MGVRSRASSLLLVGMIGCVAPVRAQAPDVKGSSDHPRVSRFAGSTIVQYKAADFGLLVLPLSPPSSPKGAAKNQNVEGRSRQVLYRIPAGHNFARGLPHL